MTKHAQNKAEKKQKMIRIGALVVAGVMAISVVIAMILGQGQ